jgi:hypothetical protein
MTTHPPTGRRLALTVAGLAVVVAATLAIVVSATQAESGHHHGAPGATRINHKQLAFHDAMRKLWEDHVTWTRLAIVSFAHDLPDLSATETRLLRNQTDIGDAVKPYYGPPRATASRRCSRSTSSARWRCSKRPRPATRR